MSLDVIRIACGLDKNYAPHLAAMLVSVQDYGKDNSYEVYVIHSDIDEELQNKVEKSVPKIKINWIKVENDDDINFKEVGYISKATYLRLLMDDLLPTQLDKILYLDVDITVCGNVRLLWDEQLDGKSCAAVTDPGVNSFEFAKKWDFETDAGYFNAGIMLLDMTQIRRYSFFKKSIDVLRKNEKKCEYSDQDALNVALFGNWKAIDISWNYQRKFLYEDNQNNNLYNNLRYKPNIIHFTEAYKPWKNDEWHPLRWLYVKALLKTPFANEYIRQKKLSWFYIFKSYAVYQYYKLKSILAK